ncbi:SDR family oxidoreductase [Pseudoalteromonas sp. MMG010]|uniref:SDR family oxidoreductase n=1 Tax=Pseudoalteromonas sp. MMG010 TaxID=2822685 RepID=UPI001B3A37DF|nr:SDR family oxidoreductase [Pseudoalteromonas sp. MMG010]MBQ4831872.1 SDR family oxidoreductase [Pseudoalteromonas sp. MMG010]
MSKTLIIGASGQIGKMTIKLLLENQHNVVALVRDKEKLSDLNSPHLTIVERDLESDFSDAFEGCNQVIFAAGSGGNTGADKTLLIDLWAAKKAASYAKQYQIEHFVMISSIGADNPDAVEGDIKPYLVAKHMADQHLINQGVPYTILRPGTLTNEPGSQLISTRYPNDSDKAKISRENVANALYTIATNTFKRNRIISLFNGEQAIPKALS